MHAESHLLSPSRDGLASRMDETANKSELAYAWIEEMITFQDLLPGALVSETMLAERTGLSRTPVREALQRLAREGMIEIHPKRGILVAPLSVEAQLQLLEIRRSLEQLAVGLAVRRSTADHRHAMAELADALESFTGEDCRAFGPLLRRSHSLIASAAQNPFLPAAMAPLHGLSRRFWFANMQDVAADLHDGGDKHIAILRAIHGQDTEAATPASLALNDYLVQFAHRTLERR